MGILKNLKDKIDEVSHIDDLDPADRKAAEDLMDKDDDKPLEDEDDPRFGDRSGDMSTKDEMRADLDSADEDAQSKRAGGPPESADENEDRDNFIDLHGQDK